MSVQTFDEITDIKIVIVKRIIWIISDNVYKNGNKFLYKNFEVFE